MAVADIVLNTPPSLIRNRYLRVDPDVPEAKLQLHYSGKLTIKNAVKCEKGSELIIQSIN